MTQVLRQSTQVVVRVGPAVAVANGFVPVTNLTVSGADEAEALRAAGAATLDISGATFAAVTSSDGWYDLTLTTTATNTIGTLEIVIQDDSLILPIHKDFQVMEEAVYDALYAASAVGPLPADSDGTVLTEAGGTGDHLTAIDLPNQTMDITGNLSGSVGSVTGGLNTAGTITTLDALDTAQDTQHSDTQSDIAGLNDFNPAVDAVATVTAVTNGVLLAATATSAQLVDDVWDEVLTGATHNVAQSSGRRLRALGGVILHEGTAQAGAANSITLDTGASTIDDFYLHTKVLINGGTGAEQEAIITGYVGSTRVASTTPTWRTNPDATSEFEVIPGLAHAQTIGGSYTGAAVHVNTITGVAGSVPNVNGIDTNPVDNLTDARLIADDQNLTIYQSHPGSDYTLAAAHENWTFNGINMIVNLGSQLITNSVFIRGSISGTGIQSGGVVSVFELCAINNLTVPRSNFLTCGIAGTTTLSDENIYLALSCNTAFNATTTPIIDVAGAGGGSTPTTLLLLNYSGEVEIQNMITNDVIFITGNCILTFNANCTGGTYSCAGNVDITNNGSVSASNINACVAIDRILSDSTAFQGADIALILADSNELQTDWANAGRLDVILDARSSQTSVDAIATTLGTPTDTDVSTDIANLASDIAGQNDLTQAEIRSAVGLASANLDTQLGDLSSGIIFGAAVTGTLTTVVATTDLTGFADDRIIGRVLIWLTGTSAGEATRITDYASTNGTLTYTAMSTTPSNTDTFKIV